MTFVARGIHTAIVTPMTDAGELDEGAFRKLIDFQITSGISGLLVAGGAGEYVNLSPLERARLIEVAVDQAAGRVPVIAGALSPGTREVQAAVKDAAEAGADAVLVLPPYYVKTTQVGVIQHFEQVADSAAVPIVAYNNSGRTGVTLDVGTLEKLAEIPSIVALKECERDLAVISAKIRAVGDRMAILSGDDDLGFPTFLLGSPGGIFMSSNLVPAIHCKLFEACATADVDTARRAHYTLLPLIEALYTANHPGPLKDAMALIGHPVGVARAPLQRATVETLSRVREALKEIRSEVLG